MRMELGALYLVSCTYGRAGGGEGFGCFAGRPKTEARAMMACHFRAQPIPFHLISFFLSFPSSTHEIHSHSRRGESTSLISI